MSRSDHIWLIFVSAKLFLFKAIRFLINPLTCYYYIRIVSNLCNVEIDYGTSY